MVSVDDDKITFDNERDFGTPEFRKWWLTTRQAKWMIFKGKVYHFLHRSKFLAKDELEEFYKKYQ